MTKTILLVCGHWNVENITALGLRKWRAWSTLKSSTGASGERDWIWNKLMPLLKDKLIASGVQVFITDAIYHEETYSRDYDLCIALHYDGGGTDSRCIISKPLADIVPPFISSTASLESDKFIAEWLSIYPNRTGILSRQDRITEGMTDYYAWDYVKEGTPSAIIEHGNNTCPADHDRMFNQTEVIAQADVDAICKYLGVNNQPPVVQEEHYQVVYKGQTLSTYEKNPIDIIDEITKQLETVKENFSQEIQNNATLQSALTTQEQDNAQLNTDKRKSQLERDNALAELKEAKSFARDLLAMEDLSANEFREVSETIQGLRDTILKLLANQSKYTVVMKITSKLFLGKLK